MAWFKRWRNKMRNYTSAVTTRAAIGGGSSGSTSQSEARSGVEAASVSGHHGSHELTATTSRSRRPGRFCSNRSRSEPSRSVGGDDRDLHAPFGAGEGRDGDERRRRSMAAERRVTGRHHRRKVLADHDVGRDRHDVCRRHLGVAEHGADVRPHECRLVRKVTRGRSVERDRHDTGGVEPSRMHPQSRQRGRSWQQVGQHRPVGSPYVTLSHIARHGEIIYI